MKRPCKSLIKQIGLFLICFSAFAFSGEEEQNKGTICLQIEGIQSANGNIGILVFNREHGFPQDKQQALIHRKVQVVGTKMQIDLNGLPYGKYAIAVVHDINANLEFDKNFLGIPKEPFGFSKNKSIYKGLPDFHEASIQLSQNRLETKIELIKLL